MGSYMDFAVYASAVSIVMMWLVLSRVKHAVDCVSQTVKGSRVLQVLLSGPSLCVFAGSVGLLPGVPDEWMEPDLSYKVTFIGFGGTHALIMSWILVGWVRRTVRRTMAESALRSTCKSSACDVRARIHV